MAINKITPRELDKSTDYKLVPATAFIDAVNVVFGEDESNEGDDGGDAGVIKNLRGNKTVKYFSASDAIADGDFKIIGKVEDRKFKLIYFFVYHEDPNNQGVWVYDKNGVLGLPYRYAAFRSSTSVADPGKPNTIKKIVTSNQFNFKQNSVIQGNIIYSSALNIPKEVADSMTEGGSFRVDSSEKEVFEKNFHLYFTDNVNEPKKIDVTASLFSRTLVGINEEFSLENLLGEFPSSNGGVFRLPFFSEGDTELIKFLNACKPTPLQRPTFEWKEDIESKANNFEKSEGFKFAYQVVYNDGSVSAISPKSELAAAPTVVFQGNNKNPDHSIYNVCTIKISDPILDSETTGLPAYIKQVNVLAQEGIGGYKIVKEIPIEEIQEGTLFFDFKNDVIGIPISDSEENKFFDSVPQVAEAQAVVDNRLMYGNYIEGFPSEKVNATLNVQYAERPNESFGVPFEIDLTIAMDKEQLLSTGQSATPENSEIQQRLAGFRITIPDDTFPSLGVNDILNFSISFLPERNFHIYNAINSYHQSRQLGINNNDEEALWYEDLANGDPFFAAGQDNLLPTGLSNTDTNIVGNEDTAYNAFIDNGGVTSFTWTTVDSRNSIPSPIEVTVGSSAAHPLIVPGGALSFSVQLKCLQAADPNTLRTAFFEIVDNVLSRGNISNAENIENDSNTYFSVSSVNPYDTVSWDAPISNFQRTEEGSSLSKAISMVAHDGACRGGIYLKKGSAVFGLTKTTKAESANDPVFEENYDLSRSREYRVYLDNIPMEGLEIWTAVRKWLPNSPWFLIDPQWLAGVTDGTSNIDDFYETTEFSSGYTPDQVQIVDTAEQAAAQETGSPLFFQHNDARDFVPRQGFYFQVVVGPSGQPNFFINPVLRDDYSDAEETLSTVIGFASNFNPIPGPIVDYFVCCSHPSQFVESGVLNAGPNDPRARIYSVFDGEGGPGGSLPTENVDLANNIPEFEYTLGKLATYDALNFSSSAFGRSFMFFLFGPDQLALPDFIMLGPWFTPKIYTVGTPSGVMPRADVNDPRSAIRSTLPMIQGAPNGLTVGASFLRRSRIYSLPFDDFNGGWEGNTALNFSFRLRNSHMEFLTSPVLSTLGGIAGVSDQNPYNRSFKSSCDHDFGVVYYDKLGRRSFVNQLGSVYVKGFSLSERGDNKGAASVRVLFQSPPPYWAEKYQIVYGGNKSVSDFLQYSTNNAFIEPTGLGDGGEAEADVIAGLNAGKIFVSLNMLQQSSISYAREFGAVNEDGSFSVYKFKPGDKVRIVSYTNGAGERLYPTDFVFEVIELVSIDPAVVLTANDHPLVPDTETTIGSEFYGDFLVLRNNEQANGFAYSDLLSDVDLWDQGVVIEIFSPKKSTGVETQVYREVGEVYDILGPTDSKYYSVNPVEVYEGDVFLRPVAVNMNEYEGASFVDLLSVDEDALDGSTELKSNFQKLFLESSKPTDLFPSKMKNLGRPNVEATNARRLRRESGIIYSDKNDADSSRLNYSSFNASLFPFKDLEERFGNINFMDELGGNLFVIQQDRCTIVPVSATILSNAVGQDQLIASNEILGKEQVYSVTAGCDNNPESVVRVDNTYYFVHKNLGKVFMFKNGQGISDISSVNMSSYFRSKFKEALDISGSPTKNDVRIPGGYDPVKDEYLVTILTPKSINVASSEDDVIVYGCTDPLAANYDSNATKNDGSCVFDDTEEDLGSANVQTTESPLLFDEVPLNGVEGDGEAIIFNTPATLREVDAPLQTNTLVKTFSLTNTGESTAFVKAAGFIANPGYLAITPPLEGDLRTDAYTWGVPPGGYAIEPGQTVEYKIFTNPTNKTPPLEPGDVYNAVAVLEFFENDGLEAAYVATSSVVRAAPDPEPQVGDVTINFYLGGKLIDQQFAEQDNGVWTVVIDQNRLIRSINNSYSGDGSETPSGPKALLEVELEFDRNIFLGQEVSEDDIIRINGEIVDGLDGFNFVPLAINPFE